MPFLTVKLLPGVKVLQTPTLLQANVVASNLIRWRGGLPEKIGGWINFFTNLVTSGGGNPSQTIVGIARALCAWADVNLTNRLAVATSDGLNVILMGETGTPVNMDISPEYVISTGNPNPITFATAAGNVSTGKTVVTITDNSASVNQYGTVQIQCHVAVGGIVIFGAFPITKWDSANQYEITVPGVATVATVTMPSPNPSTALFAGAANSEVVTVTLANHGLITGNTFSIAMPTFIGVVDAQCELYGFYTVQQVIDANNFIIFAHNALTVTSTNWEANLGGAPQIIYWVVQAPLLPNSGWGIGGWGIGGWGSGAQPTQLPGTEFPPPTGTAGFGNVNPDDWTLANFGSILLSNPTNGPLFEWDPLSGLLNAGTVPEAPAYLTGFFISMPAQQVVTYGASTAQVQDPMLVSWCDNANFHAWTAAVNNQAGTFRLTRGSKIIGGLQGPQQAMLWTDVGLWVMAYIGYPNVYGFNEVAQGCGLIGQHAIAVYGNSVFWMGRDAFWMYANGAAQRLPCDVWDVVFKNLNVARDQNGDYTAFRHIRGGANSGYDEVFWSFPSRLSQITPDTLPFANENDSVVKFNPVTGEWDYTLSAPQQGMIGSTPFNLTAWIDNNIFGHPISAMLDPTGANSFIFQHEMGTDANGQAINWMIQTGFFMLSDGEDKVFVDYMLPDFRWGRWHLPQSSPSNAVVTITLYTAEVPDDPTEQWIAYGPYTVSNKALGGVEPRCRGRYFFAQIQGNDIGSFARLGGIKFRFAPDGRN